MGGCWDAVRWRRLIPTLSTLSTPDLILAHGVARAQDFDRAVACAYVLGQRCGHDEVARNYLIATRLYPR